MAKDTSEFDTLEELKADIKGKLEHERTHAAEDAVENQLLDQLLEGFKAEVPDAMYNHRVDESVRDFDYRLQSQGLNLQTYMQYTGMDMDAFRAGFREQAEKPRSRSAWRLRRLPAWRILRLPTRSWKRNTPNMPSSIRWTWKKSNP